MALKNLLVYFETSPAIRLLNATVNAPFIIDFLQSQFKREPHLSIDHSDLLISLGSYVEDIREEFSEALKGEPDRYLSDWCSNDTRWLKRYYEPGNDEPKYSLTAHTEDVLAFLDKVLDKDLGFVGTHSRLHLIINTLQELVIEGSDDPATRLEHLRKQRDNIEEQIARIEQSDEVDVEPPTLIRERFNTAISLLRQLLGDFRQVEENFKEITIQIQQQRAEQATTAGQILGYALDAEDELNNQDQSVSFNQFANLILSPVESEKLSLLIKQILRLKELSEERKGLDAIQGMIPSLLREATSVMRTEQRLSGALRRLVEGQSREENQRLCEILAEIRTAATQISETDSAQGIEISVEALPKLASPLSRTFWRPSEEFEPVDMIEVGVDLDELAQAIKQFGQLSRINWGEMRKLIDDGLSANNGRISLAQLLEQQFGENDIIEVLGFIQIALDDGHEVDGSRRDEVYLETRRGLIRLRIPIVTFNTEVLEGSDHE